MSKIGKQPIKFDSNKIKVNIAEGGEYNNQLVEVVGDKGTLEVSVRKGVLLSIKEDEVVVERKSNSKAAKAYHGLYRSLVANMIEGVSNGYEKKLEIHGTGFRGNLKSPDLLELQVGFSHPVEYKAPEGIELKLDDQTLITVSGVDKQLVGQVAAEIRALRKPEPYKGKGIRYEGEEVKRKAGKAAGAVSGAA